MIRRGQLEIYYDILMAIAKGKRRVTHIMYASNTNGTVLRKYLNILLKCKAITYKAPFHDITDKGYQIISYINAIREMVD